MFFRKFFQGLIIFLLVFSFTIFGSCGFSQKMRKGDQGLESNIQKQDKNFLFLMAEKEIEEENYEAAEKYLIKAIDLETDPSAKWFLKLKLAKLYFETGNLDPAGQICSELVKENPKDVEGHLLLGKTLLFLGGNSRLSQVSQELNNRLK